MELKLVKEGKPICKRCKNVLRLRCHHLRTCYVCDNCDSVYQKVEGGE